MIIQVKDLIKLLNSLGFINIDYSLHKTLLRQDNIDIEIIEHKDNL